MTANFAPMEVQLKTERLDLSMWEESDTAWLRKLVGERGVDIPALDTVRNDIIEMRKRASRKWHFSTHYSPPRRGRFHRILWLDYRSFYT